MSTDPLRYQCLNDDQEAIAEAAELTFAAPPAKAADTSWSGILIPEDLEGSGGGSTDLAVVIEALGANTSSSPIPWTLGFVAAILLEADSRPDKTLADIATGSLTASIPILDGTADGPIYSLRPADDGVTASFLALGTPQGALALPVVIDGAECLALVSPDDDSVTATVVAGMDATRPWTRYELHETRLSNGSSYPVSGLATKWRRAAAVYAGLDAAGTARKALERTLDYGRQREQFGRPLGSFQAYKHACANAFIDLKLAQSVSFRAAQTSGAEAMRYALASALDATASAARVCMTAIQLHGGIGYSAESGLHHHLLRARADQLIVGGQHSQCALVRTLLEEHTVG